MSFNKYRVVMIDMVNGQSFNFAMTYYAKNANAAGKLAINEFGCTITNTKQVGWN